MALARAARADSAPTSMGMLTRRKKPQRFNSRVAFAVSGRLLLYRQQTPRSGSASCTAAALAAASVRCHRAWGKLPLRFTSLESRGFCTDPPFVPHQC